MTSNTHLLPLAYEDLKQMPQINDAPNIAWYSPVGAIEKYWNICGIKIDIFAQAALSSSHTGLPMDFYQKFHCDKISPNCVCALPRHKRITRGSKIFLEADCDFASLKVEGPFFKEKYTPDTLFNDFQIGFKFDFDFKWHAMHASTQPPNSDSSIIGFYGISFGGDVYAYLPQYEGYIYQPFEIPYLEISIEYITF